MSSLRQHFEVVENRRGWQPRGKKYLGVKSIYMVNKAPKRGPRVLRRSSLK
jgi:hypothetical protein